MIYLMPNISINESTVILCEENKMLVLVEVQSVKKKNLKKRFVDKEHSLVCDMMFVRQQLS